MKAKKKICGLKLSEIVIRNDVFRAFNKAEVARLRFQDPTFWFSCGTGTVIVKVENGHTQFSFCPFRFIDPPSLWFGGEKNISPAGSSSYYI